jgi:hypothetical protein
MNSLTHIDLGEYPSMAVKFITCAEFTEVVTPSATAVTPAANAPLVNICLIIPISKKPH